MGDVPAHLEFPPAGSWLRRELQGLGLGPRARLALLLLPAVEIAWQSKTGPSPSARALIADAAGYFQLDAACRRVIEQWLTRRPAEAWGRRAYRTIRALARTPDELHLTWDALFVALVCAENIAALETDTEFGLPLTSTRPCCLELGIDIGQPWADLAVELDGTPPLAPAGSLPRIRQGEHANARRPPAGRSRR